MATILIVDDDPFYRLLARRTLAPAGHRIRMTTRWEPGALQEQVDLILIDVKVGDDFTPTILEALHQAGLPLPPVYFYSSGPPDELEAHVESSGAKGYIVKSEDPEPLLKTVEGALKDQA